MESRASIAGHPIHPMLVVFPIGLFVFSFVCDLVFLGTGDILWSDIAYYTIAGGIIGAVAAAVPGAIDLFSMPSSRMRSIGIVHMTINLVVVALFAINFWMRGTADPAAAGPIWLSGIGVALLAVSGWLGGEMVYVHGAGVSPDAGDEHAYQRTGAGRTHTAPRR